MYFCSLLRQSNAEELSSEGDDANTSTVLLEVPADLLQKQRMWSCSSLHPTSQSDKRARPENSCRTRDKYIAFHYILVTAGIIRMRQERRSWPNSENLFHRKPSHFISIKIPNWAQMQIFFPPTLDF